MVLPKSSIDVTAYVDAYRLLYVIVAVTYIFKIFWRLEDKMSAIEDTKIGLCY